MKVKEQIVHRDPEIMGGELVFVGTRVPLYNLFDYLVAGDSLDRAFGIAAAIMNAGTDERKRPSAGDVAASTNSGK